MFAWLDKGVDKKTIDKDPAYLISKSAQAKNYELRDYLKDNTQKIGALRTLYVEALVEMNKGTVLPPDANSTMRITYGTVGGYSPKDGVTYDYRSSINGYKEKYIENDPELIRTAGYIQGDWTLCRERQLIPDFQILHHEIGSPVINAKLIGLAMTGMGI
ncbi:MAG: S46 family peptidase [Butyricimonas faecalis]